MEFTKWSYRIYDFLLWKSGSSPFNYEISDTVVVNCYCAVCDCLVVKSCSCDDVAVCWSLWLSGCEELFLWWCCSVLVRDCRKCVVVVACHQFRACNSEQVDVFLYCSSRPTIELCSAMTFACHCYHYPLLEGIVYFYFPWTTFLWLTLHMLTVSMLRDLWH